jgi:hypothetical protein
LVQLHTLQLQDVQLPALEDWYGLAAPWLHSVGNQAQKAAAQAGADDALAVLLTWLGQLQQLCCLELSIDSRYGYSRFICSLPAAAFAALTASSGLQELQLASVWWPDAAWPHMFAAGKKLSHLTSLSLHKLFSSKEVQLPPHLLQHIAAACPGLVELGMWLTPQQDGQLAQLQQLTALSKLRLLCRSNTQASQIAGLTGLKGLVDLTVESYNQPCSLTHQGLVLLTALTQLTNFQATVNLPRQPWTSRLQLHITVSCCATARMGSK